MKLDGSRRWGMKNNWTLDAALPECFESPSGSSFGSLETLGVAHPTTKKKNIEKTFVKTKSWKRKMLRLLLRRQVNLCPLGAIKASLCNNDIWKQPVMMPRLTWKGWRGGALCRRVLCPQRVDPVLPLQVQLPRLLLALLACRTCNVQRRFEHTFPEISLQSWIVNTGLELVSAVQLPSFYPFNLPRNHLLSV